MKLAKITVSSNKSYTVLSPARTWTRLQTHALALMKESRARAMKEWTKRPLPLSKRETVAISYTYTFVCKEETEQRGASGPALGIWESENIQYVVLVVTTTRVVIWCDTSRSSFMHYVCSGSVRHKAEYSTTQRFQPSCKDAETNGAIKNTLLALIRLWRL